MAGKDYAYFIEIARQQSILTASEMLFVTPSTLSKYVQRLEKTLSVKLFDRVGKKLIRNAGFSGRLQPDVYGCVDGK